MIDKCGELVIIDFGMGDFYSKGQRFDQDQVVGAQVYLSPEKLEGKLFDPEKADVWAAGVVLYEMATGVHPFEVEFDYISTTKNIKEGKLDPLLLNKQPISVVILSMLNPNPEERPTFDEISDYAYFADHHILVKEPGVHPQVKLPFSRRIIQALSIFPKYKPKQIISDVEEVRHKVLPTLYFLILKKALEL